MGKQKQLQALTTKRGMHRNLKRLGQNRSYRVYTKKMDALLSEHAFTDMEYFLVIPVHHLI